MSANAQQARLVWEAVLGQLQLQVTRPSYETWLKDTVGLAYDDGQFVVGTPSAFVAEMLEQRMYSLISQTLEKVVRDRVDVRFQVVPAQAPAPSPVQRATPEEALPLAQAGGPALPDAQPEEAPRPRAPYQRGVALNARYTFDTFIVGKSNELAHAAAVAVSQKPGTVYNPLVMYSDVGLGKTHLLHAIGHRVLAMGLSLIYATTEEFTNEYIRAIREGKTEEFRQRYRGIDVLLLDDIQFLIGKEQTQEGFFHTFNALYMSNHQLVITSDRPVSALTLLEDRVRSRLAGGLVVDIQPPDFETRLAILRAKAELLGQAVPPEVLELLAERVHTNIRELEGSLNRVVAFAQLTQSPVTLELVGRAIADTIRPPDRRRVSEEAVLEAVASYFGLDREAIVGRRRDKKTALARQVAMYLLREEANLGLTAIGRVLGGKDHTTVIHGCETISNRLKVDPSLGRDVLNIRKALVGG